ncbi:cellulase family glycosylhydrolase [Acetivibrio cellulolyticus]|uniref:cellulase family glycosylhydrolase n=1 Tax=Acetivibrio cellulolyticus TaxID=35830 RepID=UPI0001E2E72E|nr:cellulase family glycosylhydrolase [Acetivibrio cellulolyticus]
MKKIVSLFSVAAIIVTMLGITTINAAEEGTFGGYPWVKPLDYHLGTTAVTATGDSLEIEFQNINNSDHAAGAATTVSGTSAVPLDEDWSAYEAISFTVDNPQTKEFLISVGICTGEKWYWHESNTVAVPATGSKDIVLYFNQEYWKTEASKWVNNTTISDLNDVKKIDFKIISNESGNFGKAIITNFLLGDAPTGNLHNPNPGNIEAPGQFKVVGSHLYDANGVPFVMRGANHAHTWFKDQLETAIPALAKAGCNTVRVVLSNGKKWQKDDLASVKKILKLCEDNDMVAVLEVHDPLGVEDVQQLLYAAEYFVEMKEALIGKEDRVIINIANEWYGQWGAAPWAEGYKKAISVIRNAGLTHTIMVDCAGWGQYPQSVHTYGKQVFESDPLGNTMFSIHFYEYAGGTEAMVKYNIDEVVNQGLALCIGEFGWKHKDGDVAEAYIMKYCQEMNIGWLAWSWKGNGSGLEYLDLASDWAGNTLSTDWGKVVVDGPNGLKETSVKCSVFSGVIPTTGVTPTPVVTPDNYVLGDVDGNGSFNSIDFGYLRQYLLGMIKDFTGKNGKLAADVDKNGIINSIDFGKMRKVLLGMDSSSF